MIFEVKANVDVNSVMLETYKKWLNFVMGVRPMGGQMIENPSGKLAASYKLQQTGERTFALYVPDESPQSVQDWVLRHGRGAVDLKEKMLGAAAGGRVHVSKKPPYSRWRDVPIRQTPVRPASNLQGLMRRGSLDISSLLGKPTEQGIGIKRSLSRMWAKEYQTAYGNEEFRSVPQRHWRNEPRKQSRFKMKGDAGGGAVKFRRMSDRPGSKSWILKAKAASDMPAFNAAHILKQMMRGKIASVQE